MQLPNFKYRYDSDNAKAPWQNIWSNIVLAYCPFLGKQGQRIDDFSGYNRYGNLTNEHTDNWTMVGYPGYTFDMSRTIAGTSTTAASNYNRLDLSLGCTIEIMYNYDYSAGAGSNQALFDIQWGTIGERLRAIVQNNAGAPLQWNITSGNNTRACTPGIVGGSIASGNIYWSILSITYDNSTNTTITAKAITRLIRGGNLFGYTDFTAVDRPPTNWTATNNSLIQLGINNANIHQHLGYLIIYNRPMPIQFLQYRMANPFNIFEYDYPRMKMRAMAAAAGSTFLPGKPFPGLPYPILAM